MHANKSFLLGLIFVSSAAITGCANDATDIGDTMVGTYNFHVFREGPAAASGVSTTVVVKPLSGGNPDKIVGWIGLESAEGSEKVTAVFDSGDGDFDDDITCPDPLPAGSKYYFEVTTGSDTVLGSIDLK